MKKDKIRIGFVGCGNRGKEHIQILSQMEDVEFVGFCDIIEKTAKYYADVYGGKAYTDFHSMIDDEVLDVCYICTPPNIHAEQSLYCANKKMDFFLEKPIVLNVEQAKKVQRAVESSGVITMIGFQNRFDGAKMKARDILHKKGGEIAFISSCWSGGTPPMPWWIDKTQGGGQLVEQSIHEIDIFRWFIGDVERVYCEFNNMFHKDNPLFTIEDVSTATLRFRNGTLGFFGHISMPFGVLDRPWPVVNSFRIVSRNVEIRADIPLYFPVTVIVDGEEKTYGDSFPVSYITMTKLMERHFLNCLKQGKQTRLPYSEGMKTLEIVLAMVQSAEKNKPIKLPFF